MSTQPAIEAEHAEGEFRSVDGLQLYYQSWRPRAGTPRAVLALVHGFGVHSGVYGPLVRVLVRAGYAVYAFDLRGMGRSPGPRGYIRSWSEYRQDVAAFLRLIDSRDPGRPVFLAGESMGGLAVLEYAEHDPQGLCGVIAFSPLLIQPDISPFLLLFGRILSRLWPRFSLDTGSDFAVCSRDPAFVEHLRNDPLVHSIGSARLSTEMTAAIARTQSGAASFSLPLLILHGDADRLVSPNGSRTFIRNVTYADRELREYEGGYHMLPNDLCADDVVHDVAHWLERHL